MTKPAKLGIFTPAATTPCRRNFLFGKQALADAFRNRFLKRLATLRDKSKLNFTGRAAELADSKAWDNFLVLPPGFQKIRHFGWLAARSKAKTLTAIRSALNVENPEPPRSNETTAERIKRLTGVDVTLCPVCGKGHLLYLAPIASDRRIAVAQANARGPP